MCLLLRRLLPDEWSKARGQQGHVLFTLTCPRVHYDPAADGPKVRIIKRATKSIAATMAPHIRIFPVPRGSGARDRCFAIGCEPSVKSSVSNVPSQGLVPGRCTASQVGLRSCSEDERQPVMKPKDGRLALSNRDPSAGVWATHARQPVASRASPLLDPRRDICGNDRRRSSRAPATDAQDRKAWSFYEVGVCRRSSHSRTLPSASLPRISSATDERARETLNRFSRSKARARCCRIIIHRRRSATASVTDATGTIASAGCSTWKLDGIGIVIVAPCAGQAPEPLVES